MLFIMRAATCSGKDTFINHHFNDQSAVLSSDHYRKVLTGDIHTQQFNKQVFEFIHKIAEFRMANHVDYTVYNATNLRIKDTTAVLELAKKYKTPATIISIEPPTVEILKERNINRNKEQGFYIPEHVIDTHHRRYEECKQPFIDEAKNNVLVKFVEIDQEWNVIYEL